MTIFIFNIGDPVFLRTRKQVRPPRRSKLAIYQDERFDADWDRLIKWDDVDAEPIDVMNAYGIEALWTGTFDWADQPQPEFVASDLFHEHFNTDWFQTDIAPEGDLAVSGVAQYQQTLTADVSALSDADGLPDASTYVYQWQHETSPDVFEDISGATASTYTTDRYDMGKRVRYRLQYVDLLQQAYADEAGISPTPTTLYSIATSVIPFTDIPVEGEPFIQNTTASGQGAQQGHNLYANVSNVFDFNQPISGYSYQWFREDALNSGNYVEIPDATEQNYTVQAEDLHPATDPTNTAGSGGRIKVRVQYTDNLQKLEEVFSAPFAVVDSPFSGTPTIDLTLLDEDGNPTTSTDIFDVNTRASVNLSSLQDANDPLTYEYQWYAEVLNNQGTFLPVSGATSADFDITSEYEKRKLYVRVTTTDAAGNVYVSQSAETTRVNSLPVVSSNDPIRITATGTAKVNNTLYVNTGSLEDYDEPGIADNWNKLYFEFQRASSIDAPDSDWTVVRANTWGNYGGASAYTVQTGDINKYIRAKLTYQDSLGKVEQVFSTPTLIINTAATGEPVITGTFKIGQVLSVDTSGVSDDNQPIGPYSYQWFIKDPFGADTYSEISGATSSTYTVQFDDVHQDIKVEVSFTDSGGFTETVISGAVRIQDTDPTGVISTFVVEGGDPEVGKTLQVDISQVQDDNGVGPFSYQWHRVDSYKNGSTNSPISGATSQTYLIAPEDEGYQLYATAEYTDLAPRNAQTYYYSSTKLGVAEPPTARFQFESAAFVDNSGNGNNGSIYGSVQYNASNSSVYLSGDHVRIPGLYGTGFSHSQAHPKFSNGITLALRLNQSGGGYRGLINTGDSWTDQRRIAGLDWRFSNSTNLNLIINRYAGSAIAVNTYVPTNTWVHLVATYDNKNLKVYRNGVLVSSSSRGHSVPIHNSAGFNIGSSGPGVSEFINASVADINIFDYAVDASTAQALYTSSASYGYVGNSEVFVKSAVTGQPTISGRTTVDAILSSDVSAIADLNGLNTFSYQWLRDGAPISGATGTTYTAQNADFEKNITLRVSYTDLAGYAESTTSEPLYIGNRPPYGPISITNTTSPGNSPQVTHVVEADLSQMSDADGIPADGSSVTYYWFSNNVEVQSGTGDAFKQYTVQPSDYGQSIVLKISYVDGDGVNGVVEDYNTYGNLTSAGVTVVNSPVTGEVYILNAQLEQASEEEQDAVITADPSALRDINEYDDLTPDSFTYQWRRNGSNISGQTGQSYAMQWVDHGDQITVAVSFTDDEGNVETTVSSNSVTLKNTPATGDVVISGEPRVGKVLTADPSSIVDPNYIEEQTISDAANYQWHRDDGNGPVDIVDATESTYTLVEADYAKYITCTVSFNDSHGTPESITSSTPVFVDATGYPSIDGTPEVGATLTANLSAMQDVQGFTNLVYHWEAKQIDDAEYSVVSSGADQNTFVVPVGYDAAEIRVRVTYDDGDFATSDFLYVRSDVTGDLVMSGPSSPDYYVNDVVLADARNVEDLSGFPANDQISYNWYRGAELASAQTQSVIYEQEITVTSNSAISNHLVEVTLDTASLINAGKMHHDSYVHFYDEAGNKIPYWLEGPAFDARTTYWLKMDLPAGSVNVTARYCGDADFAKFSSDASIMGFSFFEDFENSLDNWVITGDSNAFSGGAGSLSGSTTNAYIQSVAKYSSPLIARAVSITTNSPPNGFTPLGFWNSTSDQVAILDHDGTSYYKNNSSNYVNFSFDGEGSGFIKDEIILTGTQAQIKRFSATQSYSSGFFSHTQGNKPLFLGARGDLRYPNQGYSTSWRFVHIRPYIAGLTVSVSYGAETNFVGSVYNVDIVDSGSDLHVVMSYTDLQGYAESVTSPTVTVSNSPFYGALQISGSPYTGETLSADTSRLVDLEGIDVTTYSYQWSANGQVLAGETASTFAVTNAYVNQVITVDVSFSDYEGSVNSATSSGVTILNTPSTGEPVLIGTPSVGEDLSVDMSSVADVDGPISNVTYAWYESAANNVFSSRDTLIAGAESSTFTIPAGYEAKEVKALVSYEDTKGESKTKYIPAPAFPEQDLDFYIDAGQKDSYALGTTDVLDLTQDVSIMSVSSGEWSNANNGRFASTTKKTLQNASRLHNLGNDFTISALAYIDPSVDNVFLSCMNYIGDSEYYQGYMFYFDSSQDRLSLRLGSQSVTNNNRGMFYFRSGGQITSAGFYLVSAVVKNYNSATPAVDFFVNGDLSGSRTPKDGTVHSALYYDIWGQGIRQPLYAGSSIPVIIGGMNSSGNVPYGTQRFDIGMLSVHRRALSDAELSSMYGTFADRIVGTPQRKLIAAPLVGTVTVSGTPQAGSTLTADASSITDQNEIISLLLTWYANGSQIGTGATRTLTTSEFNKQVTVKASYTDRAGYSHEIESAPVQVVNTPATGTVAISGTPEVGQELTAVTSALSDANGKPAHAGGFTYQWYVNDALVTPESKIHALDYVAYGAGGTSLVGNVAVEIDHAFSEDGNRKFYYAADDKYYVQNKVAGGGWGSPQQIATNNWTNAIDDGVLVEISPDGNTLSFSIFDYYGVGSIVLYEEGQSGWEQVYSVEATGLASSSGSTPAGRCVFSGDSSVAFIQNGGAVHQPSTILKKENGVWTQVEYLADELSVIGVYNENRFIAFEHTSSFQFDIWEYVKTDGAWQRTLIPGPPDADLSSVGISSTRELVATSSKVSSDFNTIFTIYRDPYGAETAAVVYRKVGDSYQVSKIVTSLFAEAFSRDGLWFTAAHYVYHWNGSEWVSANLWYDREDYRNEYRQTYPIEMAPDGDTVHILSKHSSGDEIRVSTISFFTPSYNVQSDDVFKDVRVDVSFTDNQGNAEGPIASTPVSIVNSEPQGAFTIQGGTNAGDLVYVDVSGITDANGVGNDWSFQWKSDGVAIPGATNADYTLTNADPHVLTVDGSYTDQKGTREHLSSSNTILQEGFTISSYPYDIDGDMSNLPTARATAGRTDSHNNTNSVRSIDSNDQTIEMVGYYKASSTGIQNFSASHIKSYLWIGDAAKKAVPSVSEALINSNISKEASVSLEAGKYYPVRFLAHKKTEDAPQVLTTTRTDEETISNGNWAYELPAISSNQVVTSSAGVRFNFSIRGLPGGVRVSLYSPSGTSTTLWHPQTTSSWGIADWYWGHATEAFAGEPANGVWWLRFTHDSYTASWSATIKRAGVRVYTEGVTGNSTLKHNGSSSGTNFYYSGLVAHNTWQEQDSPAGTVSISGTPGVGHTLSALLAGDWASESGHVYQWTLDGDDVYGETNSTFVVPNDKQGSSVGLRVGFFNASGAVSSAEATPVVILANSPPLGVLNVSGELFANRTLTVDPQFTDVEGIDEATRVYTWYRNDAVHATGTSYTTVEADIDATFYVEASYTDNEGEAHTIASDPFTIVNAAPVGSVTISGLYVFGQTLTATVNVSDPDGIAPNTTVYQWVRNGNVDIVGANALSYTLGADDVNQNVSMDVRYNDIFGKAEVVSSASSFVVGRPPTVDNPLEDQETYEGLDFSFTVPANTFSDPDGDPFTFSASLADNSALPAWISFDEGTQEFAGTAPTGPVNNDIKVTVDDTFYQTSDEFTLFVRPRLLESFEYNAETGWPGALPEGEPNPGFNYSSVSASFEPAGGWPTAPQINGSETLSVLENIDAATVLAVYTEANALAVTWSVAGTDAARFQINAATGELRFLASPDFEVPLDANTDNEYQLVVVATDAAGNADAKAVSVTVTDADEIPPEISGEDTPNGYDGSTAVATYTANEPVVAWTLAGPDAGFFDLVGGVLSFKVAPTDGTAADSDGDDIYEVTVRAEDVAGNVGEKPVLVEVLGAITEGLQLHLDAGNTNSYSGAGTTWYDLSGNGNNFNLQGNPSFDSIEGFTFINGDVSKYAILSSFSMPETELTVEIWYKTTIATTGIVSYATSGDDNELLLYNPGSISMYGPSISIDSGFDTTDGNWHQVVRTSNRTSGLEKLYVDGIEVYSSTLSAGQNFTTGGTFVIAQEQDSVGGGFQSSQAFGGQIANVKLYSRALPQEEVIHNFNVYKSRFGL